MKFAFGAVLCLAGAVEHEVIAEWTEVDFEWSAEERNAALESGAFIPEHNIVTGVKVCGPSSRCSSERVFATVPRWADGVPATLAEVVKGERGWLLRPWPSLAAQNETDCEQLQNIQSMELDPSGTMWVLDVGRKYFAPPSSSAVDSSCPPKLVLLDVNTGAELGRHIFPTEVAPWDGSFLNDLVLDLAHEVAYIASTGNPESSDKGALVVYDRKRNMSRRFEDASTRSSEDSGSIVIHGEDYTERLGGLAVDGIALHPSLDRLFYCALGGRELYSVSTTALRDFELSPAAISKTVTLHGLKPDISDGMSFDNEGDLYFGGLMTNSLYRWSPESPLSEARALATSASSLWWVDTFAWDGRGSIVLTSNRLNSWFFGDMDFSGKDANFRILRMPIDRDSYLDGEVPTLMV